MSFPRAAGMVASMGLITLVRFTLSRPVRRNSPRRKSTARRSVSNSLSTSSGKLSASPETIVRVFHPAQASGEKAPSWRRKRPRWQRSLTRPCGLAQHKQDNNCQRRKGVQG